MGKRIFALIICLLFMPALTVYADVIFEPQNSFYERHSNKINYYVRGFVANGSDNYAALKSEPGAKLNTGKIQNGEAVHIEWTCLYDGEYWAYAPYGNSGWIKMNELLVLYDYIAFEEENGEEFYRYEGDFSELEAAGSALSWSWPGSDRPPYEMNNIDMEHFKNMSAGNAYKDEDGREWMYLGYYFGRMNRWICLSDPLNPDIPAFNPAPEPQPWTSSRAHIEIEKEADSVLVIIIVLVGVLAVGTAVLIKVLWKPKIKETA